MRIILGKNRRAKLKKGPLKGVLEICARVKVYGTPGSSGGDTSLRLLEDGGNRLLEDGGLRLLQ